MMKGLSLFFFLLLIKFLEGQTGTFSISVFKTPDGCQKGFCGLTISGGAGPVTVTWSNGWTGTSQSGLDSGLYTVTITDSLQYDTSLSIYIEPLPCELDAPSSFTPNGDGINDYWTVFNTTNYEEYIIQVFNRWGQKVFESRKEFESWDGKNNGLPVPDGTYYFILEYTDKHYGKQTRTGSIAIVR